MEFHHYGLQIRVAGFHDKVLEFIPDNVWCNPELSPSIVRCEVDSFLQPTCMDQLPIVTVIDIPQDRPEPGPSYNFHMADWVGFWEQLLANIQDIPLNSNQPDGDDPEDDQRKISD